MCSVGTYANATGATACTTCPAGSTSVSGATALSQCLAPSSSSAQIGTIIGASAGGAALALLLLLLLILVVRSKRRQSRKSIANDSYVESSRIINPLEDDFAVNPKEAPQSKRGSVKGQVSVSSPEFWVCCDDNLRADD